VTTCGPRSAETTKFTKGALRATKEKLGGWRMEEIGSNPDEEASDFSLYAMQHEIDATQRNGE